jgi:hypothetical protein
MAGADRGTLEPMLLPPVLLLLQAPAPAPPPADPVPPARIEITTPFPVHLGSIGPREVQELVFGLRSTHDRPFQLRLLDLSLGLSLDESQLVKPLNPGETRLLHLRLDPAGLEGPIKGGVRLGTDDPAQPAYILRYDMLVRPDVAVDTLRKSLGEVAPHESPEVRFHFKREGGEPLKLALAGELPAYLDAELLSAGAGIDLRLTLRPGRLQPGTTAGLEILKVATNAPLHPLFTLYLDWSLVTPVQASPSRLVFTDLSTTLLALELKARDGQPFRILQASIQGPGFQLLDAPGPGAARQILRIRRTGSAPEAMLVLRCTNMDAPLNVPLRFLDPKIRSAPAPNASKPSP